MAWDSTFLDFIEERGPFKPIVKIVKHQFSQWGNSPTFTASTHPLFIASDLSIVDSSIQMQGYRLNTQTWTVSGGGFSFMVGSNPCGWLTRGHVLRLYLGFDGLDEADMEILDWGVVRSITSHGGVKLPTGTMSPGPWTIACDPFFAAFQNRPSNDPDHVTLFYASTRDQGAGTTSGAQTDVASDYTAGDGSIAVTSVSGFSTGDSGLGAVIVGDEDGDQFYGTYSGTLAGPVRFSPFAGGSYVSPSNDTNIAVADGGMVYEVPFLNNHPSFIFRQILASTGAALNGSFDVYPVDWGLGIDDQYIDNVDAALYYIASEAVLSDLILSIIPAVPITNGLQWLISILSPGGWFPVITQGGFSLRCAIAPEEDDPNDDVTVTDADIDDGPDAISMEAFSSDSPVAYSQVVIYGFHQADMSLARTYSISNDELPTLPAMYLWTIDYSNINTGLLFGIDDDALEWRTSIIDRLASWYKNIPQKWTLRCAGYRHFARAVGSRVLLTSGQDSIGSFARLGERNATAPRERKALVVGWFPDIMRGKITLELAVMPTSDTEIPT